MRITIVKHVTKAGVEKDKKKCSLFKRKISNGLSFY